MYKINTFLFFIFTIFFMTFGFKIISLKKKEHNKLLNLQVIKEISDLDFKIQLIFEEIIQIEQTKEFSEYIKSPNSHLKIYNFHQKMKKLFSIFGNIPLENYMNLGFFNHNNNYLIYSSYNSISKFFFKKKNIDINNILLNNISYFISKDTLFIFKKVDNQNILWFISIDLQKNFPVLYNKSSVNFRLNDKMNGIIYKSEKFTKRPKTYSSPTIGTFKYEINTKLNKDDIFIAILLILAYFQICLLLYFFNKFIRKNILNKIINNLDWKTPNKLAINDITLEINKIIHEKQEVEFMYRSYSKSYQNLLLKEYLMNLKVNLDDMNTLFERFNEPIKLFIFSQKISIKKNEKLYKKIIDSNDFVFLEFLSGIEIIIIKESFEKDIIKLIESIKSLVFISEIYDNLISIKGEWENLNKAFNKFNIINNPEDSIEESSDSEKEKQNKMIKFIEENYQKDISLTDLAEIIGETPKYTSFLFKKYTKVNFKEALTAYRINEAKKMIIKDPHIKLTVVSKKVGYNSLISFANSFKRQEKIAPSLWRDNLKKD